MPPDTKQHRTLCVSENLSMYKDIDSIYVYVCVSWSIGWITSALGQRQHATCFSVQVFRDSGQVPVLGSPYFRFFYSYTPYIYGVVPHGIAPGDDVTIHGDFQWGRLDMDRYEPEDPRGYIREARIGGFLCVPICSL